MSYIWRSTNDKVIIMIMTNFVCFSFVSINAKKLFMFSQPENLMVELSNRTPQLRLIDFGDAHRIGNTSYIHTLIGSAEFAAPEVVSGSPVGLSTDIWFVVHDHFSVLNQDDAKTGLYSHSLTF